MIEESGEVVACEGEFAWVETRRKTACGSCSVSKGCGTSVLSKVYGERSSRVKALNPIAAKPGDMVTLGLAEDALVSGSLMMYGLPLLGLIGGGILGAWLAEGRAVTAATADGVSVVSGLLGLAAGLYAVRLFSRRVARDERYQPVVLRHCSTLNESVVKFPS